MIFEFAWRYDLEAGVGGGIPVTYPKGRDVVKFHTRAREWMLSAVAVQREG